MVQKGEEMNKTRMREVSRALKPLVGKGSTIVQSGRGLKTILTYHGISGSSRFNCISPELFRRQLVWLRKHYRVVPLSDLVLSLTDEARNAAHLVAITFDDGYANFAEFALPLLEEQGFHSTVFVPSGKVGSYNDWDEGTLGFEKMPLLTYEQLVCLPERLVEIGSHGISHRRLDLLSADTAERELLDSRRDLEEGTGRRVRFFSFPHGACPQRWEDPGGGNGNSPLSEYSAVCTTRWGRFNSPDTIFSLRRVGVWDSDSFEDYMDKMGGCYDWLAAKEGVGRLIRGMRPKRRGPGSE
jgi:peptidoglycan/xylan/chitin deacetylase (PgdA/CDA1 family)